MSWEQYWYGPAYMAEDYYKAYKKREEHENWLAHLSGLYVYEALCDVAPVLHAFAKKGTKPAEYSAKPYPLDGQEEQEETPEEREKQEDQERLLARLYMTNMVREGQGFQG